MKKNGKRIFWGALFLILLSSAVYSAWLLGWSDTVTGQVTSTAESPLQAITTFNDFSIDTTSSSASKSAGALINNTNDNLSLTFFVNETVTDVNDSCTNYVNDCSTEYLYDGLEVSNGENITILAGTHTINISLSCERLSCPQSWNIITRFE